jgi:hypothetical protein
MQIVDFFSESLSVGDSVVFAASTIPTQTLPCPSLAEGRVLEVMSHLTEHEAEESERTAAALSIQSDKPRHGYVMVEVLRPLPETRAKKPKPVKVLLRSECVVKFTAE